MYRLKQIYPHAVLLTLYQAIIYPHFIYGLLVWGSKIENGHPLHLLQKKALRIVANQDYIAHSEPICKALNLVKVPDMYTCAVWNFYYKLMNNLLPPITKKYHSGIRGIYITNTSTTMVFANEKTRFTTITVSRLLLPFP